MKAHCITTILLTMLLGCGQAEVLAPDQKDAAEVACGEIIIVPKKIFTEVAEKDADAILKIELQHLGKANFPFPLTYPLKREVNGDRTDIVASIMVACGGSGGMTTSIRLNGPSPDRVTVDVSVRGWITGDLSADLDVPWLGKARKELGQGNSIVAYFEKPKK